MAEETMQIRTGYCQICDAEIEQVVPTKVPVEVSLDHDPKYNPYANIVLVRKKVICEACKQALKKLIGK